MPGISERASERAITISTADIRGRVLIGCMQTKRDHARYSDCTWTAEQILAAMGRQ